jgi:hypothetical protein
MNRVEAEESSIGSTNESCCSRLLWDLKVSPLFSIGEPNGQYLDVALSFGGIPAATVTMSTLVSEGGTAWRLRKKWLILPYRSLILAWCISTLVLYIIDADNGWLWMGYLSNWALILSNLSLLSSWICTAWSDTICRQPIHDIINNNLHDGGGVNLQTSTALTPSCFIKITWILFTLAAVTEVLVTILFWALLRYNHNYLTVMVHGIIASLVLFDGLVVGRIPIRFKHSLFLFIEVVLFLIWDLLHTFLGMGDGTYRGANDNPLYSVLDWRNNPMGSVILVILVIFVGCPLIYTFVWMISVLGCHCRELQKGFFLQLDGSRRFIYTSATTGATTAADNT